MNYLLSCTALLIAIANLVMIIRAKKHQDEMMRNLRRKQADWEAWAEHFQTLRTGEEQVASLKAFLQGSDWGNTTKRAGTTPARYSSFGYHN